MPQPFAGFAPPTSNTTYTPNQFFDVCLPHASRGTVRLVAYLIRKTLGWCDEQGRPQNERHAVSYAELIEDAGISRAMIRAAIDEAVKGHFILCIEPPKAKKVGQASASGQYELKWDERGQYVKDPKQFRGFFAGEGNRTYIPNQFFDDLVPSQSLAVLKVVGSVIRFSIGFANKWGHRRRNVALSLRHIKNYSRISDTKNVSDAVQAALVANFIELVEAGCFDLNAGKTSKAAVYALRWAETGPERAVESQIGMELPAAPNEPIDRPEIASGIGTKSPAGHRYENASDIEIKQLNKTLKQQSEPIAATFERLRREGFDARAARVIASSYPAERVERQIRWVDRRNIKTNRLGLLRIAIEQDWAAPGTGVRTAGQGQLGQPNCEARPAGTSYADALSQVRNRFINKPNSSTP